MGKEQSLEVAAEGPASKAKSAAGTSDRGPASDTLPVTYVVPIRGEAPIGDELVRYLRRMTGTVAEVVVVDGAAADIFDADRRLLDGIRVVRPSRFTPNGKVGSVLTGIAVAMQDAVVIADDDVRYEPDDFADIIRRLRTADAVVPQNVFRPQPWHARWDTARSLIHRALGADMPGTIALLRTALPSGYDGGVLFENLELLRTVQTNGGRIAFARDLFVARRPPTTVHFISQRVRQAYDEFARPGYMLAWLSILPIVGAAVARRRAAPVLGVAIGSIAIAEFGRRRDGGRTEFMPTAALWAPMWLAERAVCSWLAVLAWLRGGARYHGIRIRRAATPRSRLRRLVAAPAASRRPT